MINLQDNVIRDQRAKIRQLEQQIDTGRKAPAPPAPPPPTPQQRTKEFMDDPEAIINRAVERQVKPLLGFVEKMQTSEQYAGQKARLRVDSRFAKVFSKIEPGLDEWIAQQTQFNPEALNTLAYSLIGLYYTGQLPGAPLEEEKPKEDPPKPDDDKTRTEGQRMIDPPHLRPSAPPMPGSGQPEKKKTRELSENERILARARGMSDEEWVELSDLPPDKVITWKSDRQKAAASGAKK
jgi:hypothetical protein